jgi:hypothetical protein
MHIEKVHLHSEDEGLGLEYWETIKNLDGGRIDLGELKEEIVLFYTNKGDKRTAVVNYIGDMSSLHKRVYSAWFMETQFSFLFSLDKSLTPAILEIYDTERSYYFKAKLV